MNPMSVLAPPTLAVVPAGPTGVGPEFFNGFKGFTLVAPHAPHFEG